jgi:hypothetical protein
VEDLTIDLADLADLAPTDLSLRDLLRDFVDLSLRDLTDLSLRDLTDLLLFDLVDLLPLDPTDRSPRVLLQDLFRLENRELKLALSPHLAVRKES